MTKRYISGSQVRFTIDAESAFNSLAGRKAREHIFHVLSKDSGAWNPSEEMRAAIQQAHETVHFTVPQVVLRKAAQSVEDNEGVLTAFGQKVLTKYAKTWVERGMRDLDLERAYPDLDLLFYDIRSDPELARAQAEE